MFGGENRCLDCCEKHGIPEDAENDVAKKLRERPKPAPKPAPAPVAAAARVPGPNQVGRDPGNGSSSGRIRKAPRRAADRPANTGVITQLESVLPAEAPKLRAKAPHPQYQGQFIDFMEYYLGRELASDQEFDPAELRQIRPHHIVAFFHQKAYNKQDVNYQNEMDQPVHHRCRSLAGAKSAISYSSNEASNFANSTISYSSNQTTFYTTSHSSSYLPYPY